MVIFYVSDWCWNRAGLRRGCVEGIGWGQAAEKEVVVEGMAYLGP